jgi:hypothetical protein
MEILIIIICYYERIKIYFNEYIYNMFYIISEFKWIIQKLKIYIMNMFLIIYYLYNLELILKKKYIYIFTKLI